MEFTLEKLIGQKREKLIFILSCICGGVAPGTLTIALFWPEILSSANYTKLFFLSVVSTAPIVFISFLIISILGYASGKPRTTRSIMLEFTFALLTCLISYCVSLIICYLFDLNLKVYIILVLVIASFCLWYFIKAREPHDI